MPNQHQLKEDIAEGGLAASEVSAETLHELYTELEDNLTATVPISLLGISHHTASLSIRGSLGLAGESLVRVLHKFTDSGFDEVLALSTCNRTEVYFVGGCREVAERILLEESGLSFEELAPALYWKAGPNAVKHLFKVFCGLDSAVLGETEILAQLKEAVTAARQENCIGRHLDLAIRKSHSASRRVRSETELCRNVTSIGSLAVREAAQYTGGLEGKTVVVIGAGKIAERIAKELANHHPLRLIFVNRTHENAANMARRYDGHARTLGELEYTLTEADAVFAATSSDRPVVCTEAVAQLGALRNDRPLTIVDLGVPPNIHPSAATVNGIHLLDMDEMIARCSANSKKRMAAIPVAFHMLQEEVDEYLAECERKAASPSIEALVRYTDSVKHQNLKWASERLGHLSPQDLKIVSDLAHRMVKGFLQSPIRELKDENIAPESRDLVTKLFRTEIGGDSHQ